MIKQGKKIKLRDWQVKDLSKYRFWYSGNKKWMDYNGPYYPNPTPEEVAKKIEEYTRKIRTEDWENPRQRLVIVDASDDVLIGTVSWYWQSEETNWKSIGIAIYDDQSWGKGIGYEALRLWVDYLFEEDKTIVRLDIRTWSGNPGMVKIAQKAGFKHEACFRKARIVKGIYYDSIGMGILREEWSEI